MLEQIATQAVELLLQAAAAHVMFAPTHEYHGTSYPTYPEIERRARAFTYALNVRLGKEKETFDIY